jgi:hypothetical protein
MGYGRPVTPSAAPSLAPNIGPFRKRPTADDRARAGQLLWEAQAVSLNDRLEAIQELHQHRDRGEITPEDFTTFKRQIDHVDCRATLEELRRQITWQIEHPRMP